MQVRRDTARLLEDGVHRRLLVCRRRMIRWGQQSVGNLVQKDPSASMASTFTGLLNADRLEVGGSFFLRGGGPRSAPDTPELAAQARRPMHLWPSSAPTEIELHLRTAWNSAGGESWRRHADIDLLRRQDRRRCTTAFGSHRHRRIVDADAWHVRLLTCFGVETAGPRAVRPARLPRGGDSNFSSLGSTFSGRIRRNGSDHRSRASPVLARASDDPPASHERRVPGNGAIRELRIRSQAGRRLAIGGGRRRAPANGPNRIHLQPIGWNGRGGRHQHGR